jgi:hypothetical protein
MKLRLGFVTNSSSTNFVIAWKGKKEDFAYLISKHKEAFPDTYIRPFSSNYEERFYNLREIIVEQIIEVATERISQPEKYIKGYENQIADAYDQLKYLEKPGRPITEFERELYSIRRFETVIDLIKDKDWVTNIYFGDNEGDFEGPTGYAMRYEGPNIYVADDFIIYNTFEGS